MRHSFRQSSTIGLRRTNRLVPAAALAGLLLAAGCSLGEPEVRDERLVFPYAQGIYYLTSYGSEDDVERPSWFQRWIIGADQHSAIIDKPFGVAVTKGRVYVNDGRTQAGYWVFDLTGKKLSLVQNLKLTGSTGIAVDSRDYKYLVGPNLLEAKTKGTIATDKETGRLLVFDERNRKVQEAEIPGRPIGVAVWEDRLFVTDLINHRVLILDKHSLGVVGTFGHAGLGDAEFQFPKGIAMGGDGLVYVGDTMNGRVKAFTQDGQFVAQFGNRSTVLGTFQFLSGIDADHEGRVFAVDAGYFKKFNRDEIQILDSAKFYAKGEAVPAVDSGIEVKQAVLGFFDKPYGSGSPNDPLRVGNSLYQPTDIAIDYANVDFFREYTPEGYEIRYLIWLTSQGAYSGKNLSVFAYATKK